MPASLRLRPFLAAAVALLASSSAGTIAPDQPWGPWFEPETPFFSSVLDARQVGDGMPTDNLSPRTIVLPAGSGHWLAFDTDLLRVAAVWQGSGVTPRALAPGSYHAPDKKTPGGQNALPAPDGTVWLANGIYPGWQVGETPSFIDPREPAPSPEEVGRGPMDAESGRFAAVQLSSDGAVLEYHVAGTVVRERAIGASLADGSAGVVRHIEVGPTRDTLWLVLGVVRPDIAVAVSAEGDARPVLETRRTGLASMPGDVQVLRVPSHHVVRRFAVAIAPRASAPRALPVPAVLPTVAASARWPSTIETTIVPSVATDAYVVDDIPLPVDNPWRRNVRLSDIQFLPDGTGVGVTLDGDVWTVRGLATADGSPSSGSVQWRRFASGLHEPLSVAVRDGEIYTFDRNGVWRLRDTNGDGEADRHELFSNAFAQTADMREFPSTLRLGPRGEFVIAKGGQEATTIGKHNGSVLRLSADGSSSTVLGYGLRQPQLAVNGRTGLVTSSDQQGHYIPSTPLHIVRDRQYYGFLSDKLPREVYPAPIADPLVWIPHSVNASAMSQVWLFDARMGPLTDGLVHIAYNRPELFRVLLDLDRPTPQATVVSITSAFDYPPLNGSVNPADGQLYIAGFQIIGWGTTATRMAGLGRVRYTGAPVTLLRQMTPTQQGVLLRFDVALDAATASDPSNYTLATWGYQRTYRYGSPQLKSDGTPGTDELVPSAAYVSPDRRSVFIAVPGMTPVMQLQVGWTLESATGEPVAQQAWTTPYELAPFDPKSEGFGNVDIDLTPRTSSTGTAKAGVVSVAEGRRVYEQFGCMACHAIDRTAATRLGPPLAGLYGTPRTLVDRQSSVVADETYLRESIREPASAVVEGYQHNGVGMPSYAGVLTDAEIESVVEFIRSLR